MLFCSQPSLGRGAGLVVGDHELAVGVELEAVDDAADGHAAAGDRADPQLDAEHGDVARVFHLEVALDEHFGVGVERRPLLVGELEVGELGMGGDLGLGAREVGERGLDACARPAAAT